MWFTVTCVYSSFIANYSIMSGSGILLLPTVPTYVALDHKDSGHTMTTSHTEVSAGPTTPSTRNMWIVEEEEGSESI